MIQQTPQANKFKQPVRESFEELRKAVVHYRALFDELLEVREPRQEIIAEKHVAAR